MKREFLKEFGLEDEQIEKIMGSNGYDITEAIKKAEANAVAKMAPELEKLKEDRAALEELRKKTMSADDLIKKAQEEAEAEKNKYLTMQGQAIATTILTKVGVKDDALTKILPGIVSSDISVTEQRAKDYAGVFASAVEAAAKAKEEELLRNTNIDPPSGTSNSTLTDIQKKLAEAQESGNVAEAAYYTRLAQQNQ